MNAGRSIKNDGIMDVIVGNNALSISSVGARRQRHHRQLTRAA
jgi:hypothetical protein